MGKITIDVDQKIGLHVEFEKKMTISYATVDRKGKRELGEVCW